MKGRSLTFLLLIVCSISGFTQVDVNNNCKLSYQKILSLKFDEALHNLTIEKKTNPENVYPIYLENYIDFLTVFISEDEALLNELEDNKSDRIDIIKQLDDSSPYKKYILGNINLQWAVARLKFHEYFTAAIEINRAYRYLKSNAEEFPDFVPNNISLGVLHIMIGVVPQKYQWLLNLINMEGEVEQGREELMLALEKANTDSTYAYLKKETLFYLGFVENNIASDSTYLSKVQQQIEMEDPSVLLLSYLNIRIHMRTGQNEKALNVFEQIDDREGYYPFYYLDYLESECRLRKLEISEAGSGYDRFLDNFKGNNYIKDAWRKKAWIALIQHDTTLYRKYMKAAFGFGEADVGQDKDALREAHDKVIPNIDLIKARLLFDGGYYTTMDSVLFLVDTNSLNQIEKVEWGYRLARSYHQQGKSGKAKSFYEKTITEGAEFDRYFAGNSSLKLGEIYEQEGNLAKAIFYYSLCLELEFNEYESGIHSQAKAGLKRLSE